MNVSLLLQQKTSRLRDAVTFKSGYRGKQVSPIDQLGAIEMQSVVGQFAPIGRVDATVDRRWVAPLQFDLNQIVDSFDKLKVLSDPQSSYVMNAMQAANRKFDDLIIAAFIATAATGETGATSTTILAGNTVSVSLGGTASALNVDKLKRAKRLLRANEVEEDDPIFCAITAQDEEALLNEIQIINADYFKGGNGMASQPVLAEGKLDRYLGINFIHSERILSGTDDAAGTSRSVPVWAKSGMHLAVWEDVKTDVSQRKDLSGHPWQAYIYMMANATRLEEKKVVRVWCR
jgi:autonomous glycyl radical cofactor GrcA